MISLFAGTGTAGHSGDGGPARNAQLYSPNGVAIDSKGDVYISEGCWIRKVDASGNIATVAGTGGTINAYGLACPDAGPGDGGPGINASLTLPQGLAIDGADNLYIAETYDVRKLTPGGNISTVAGQWLTPGPASYSGPAPAPAFSNATGVAVDTQGNLYVTDYGNYVIRKIVAGAITTYAGSGLKGYSPDGTSLSMAEFSGLSSPVLDSNGNLLFADCFGIRIITPAGALSSVQPLTDSSGEDVLTSCPSAVIRDRSSNTFVNEGYSIVQLTPSGSYFYVAGGGTISDVTYDGPAINAMLGNAGTAGGSMAIDTAGRIYFADETNNVVRVLTPAGAQPPGQGSTNPVISSLSPPTLPAGVSSSCYSFTAGILCEPTATVNISGANFASGATVQWVENSETTTLTPTSVTTSTIAVQIPANLLVTAGTAQITVVNPGGLPSNTANFMITGSATTSPAITSLTPSSLPAGSASTPLNINGANFVSGANIQWVQNGQTTTLTPTSVTSSSITVQIPENLLTAAGTAQITVVNAGIVSSNAATLTITPPASAPGISDLSPASVPAGSASFTLTVNGSGFAPGDVVLWNGNPLPTTYVSSSQLQASVSSSSIAQAGTVSIVVSGEGILQVSDSGTFPQVIQATNWSSPGATWSFSFFINSRPGVTPSSSTLFIAPVSGFQYTLNGVSVSGAPTSVWSSQGNASGLSLTFPSSNNSTPILDFGTPQLLFSGPTSSPTILAGTYADVDTTFQVNQGLAIGGATVLANTNLTIRSQSGGQNSVSASFTISPPSSPSQPAITPGGVVPIFSSATTIQPAEWVSIFGTNLASATTTWDGDFPTSLGGVSVTIDGKPAYLWLVSPTQINLQAPGDTTTGSVPVVVTTPAGTATSTVTLAPFAPSFSLLDSKHVAGIILRSNGSGAYGGGTYDIIGPTGNSLGYATVAAKAGDEVELFGVGFGPTSPVVPAGEIWSGPAPTTNPVSLLIDNVKVVPSFAGLSEAGLYQINLTIPAGLGAGDLPLAASVGGAQTPSYVVISLQ